MATTQEIIRYGSIDCGHRILNHPGKSINPHGHTLHYKLVFDHSSPSEWGLSREENRYMHAAVDWMNEFLDHANILNPMDSELSKVAGPKWFMSLYGEGKFCNPTIENISKEIFIAMEVLLSSFDDVRIARIELHVIPTIGTICTHSSISGSERAAFLEYNEARILEWYQAEVND